MCIYTCIHVLYVLYYIFRLIYTSATFVQFVIKLDSMISMIHVFFRSCKLINSCKLFTKRSMLRIVSRGLLMSVSLNCSEQITNSDTSHVTDLLFGKIPNNLNLTFLINIIRPCEHSCWHREYFGKYSMMGMQLFLK